MKKLWGLILAALMAMVVMSGCGGGGESGGGAANMVTGVAAAGSPLVGTVSLKDSSAPAKVSSPVTIGADGTFAINVDGMKPPFILKAQGAVGSTNYTLYSFAPGTGIANINSFAHIAVSMASGGLDPATIYAASSAGTMQTISSKLPVAITDIQNKLQVLLALYDVAKIDLVASNFIANHTGLDEVLDMVSVDLSAGVITIRNKATNAVIFATQASNFAGGTLNVGNIPTPPIRAVISPIFVSVPMNKSVTFTADVLRSTNKSVTWAVVESGGGTITSAGVYTAPAIDGTYRVKVTSAVNPSQPTIAIVKVIPANVIVDVTPVSATVAAGGSKAFSATVTGTSNTAVTWSVVETNGGSVSSYGVYAAPSAAGTYHVKATSLSDPSKSDTAEIFVTPVAPVVVSITPATASISTSGTIDFTATVTGASNTAVTWSVNGVAGSATNSTVTFSNSTPGTYNIKATSVADPSKSATAVVTVTVPQPWPIGTWVGPNGFKFTVSKLVVNGPFGVNQYSGVVYYPTLSGGSLNVSGTDTLIGIIATIYDSNNASLDVAGGQVSPTFTNISVTLNGSPYSGSFSGFMSINSSNTAYNYFDMNAVFTKQ